MIESFRLFSYIPRDIDIEVLVDLESSIIACSELEGLLSVDGIMEYWYQIIVSKGTKSETFVEHAYTISNYIDSLPEDMRGLVISQLETFNISIIDQETWTVLNSPQVSLIGDTIEINGDIHEYTLPPGGEFIEYNNERQHNYDRRYR